MYHRSSPKGWDHWFRVMSYRPGLLRKDATFVPEVRSPTVRRRELGALLRKLRTEQGLTVEQAAEHLMFSMSKLSRIETGHGVATPRDIRDLCELYRVTDQAEREHIMQLGREAKQPAWYQSYDLHDFETYVGLEEAAVGLKYYQSTIVPGLLQTADYTRAMNEVVVPALTPEQIDENIEIRLRRQQLLTRDPPLRIWAICDEAALRRIVGGPAVMAAQLDRLLEMASLPAASITIQVIPFHVGAHPAMAGTFNILEFFETMPSVVYVEGLLGRYLVERPHEVIRYQQVFEQLQAVALTQCHGL
jgi:transcriptional regulator with XRE-family HTH domain